jgi:hypothetical protein
MGRCGERKTGNEKRKRDIKSKTETKERKRKTAYKKKNGKKGKEK